MPIPVFIAAPKNLTDAGAVVAAGTAIGSAMSLASVLPEQVSVLVQTAVMEVITEAVLGKVEVEPESELVN